MTTSDKLIELTHAEEPARQLLERLGWTYVRCSRWEKVP